MGIDFERRHVALKAIHDAKALPYEIWLGYNADGDLVEIRKKVAGTWFKRVVKLADVTDFEVAAYDKFEGWTQV